MAVALTFTPQWFYGIDSLFDFISLLVAVLIFYFSYRVYKVVGNKNYSIMFYSFVGISLSFLIKIFANLSLYYAPVRVTISSAMSTVVAVNISKVFISGVFFYRFAFLLSMALLFWLTLRVKDKRVLALMMVFAVVAAELSFAYYSVFHMVAAVFLLFIFSFFQSNYSKRKTTNALQVALAFLFIFLSQAAFVFMILQPLLYAIGEVLQLLGYGLLLFNIISVLKR